MKAKKINEALPVGMFDTGNTKAIRGWTKEKTKETIYTISTKEPVTIVTDDEVEAARVEFIFNKNRIKFEKSQKSL